MPATSTLGEVFLTRVWLFQAIVAGPTFVLLGGIALLYLDNDNINIYDFVACLFSAIMAAGIIFVVLIQRQFPAAGKKLTFWLEVAKSLLATGLWIWLMVDAIWNPGNRYYYKDSDRRRRIVASSISGILLWLLFYPTAAYATYVRWYDQESLEESERTPLLGDGPV